MAAGLVTMTAGLALMIWPASIMPGPGLLLVSYAMVVGGVAVALLGANLLNRADDREYVQRLRTRRAGGFRG